MSMLVYYETNSFFRILKVSHHWSVQLIFKVLLSAFAEVTSSFRSFIVSCCFLIQILSDIASSRNDYLDMFLLFSDSYGFLDSSLFLYLHCSGSAFSDCTEGSGSSILMVFEHFLVFDFPFSQFSTIIFFLFPEVGDFSGNS